MRDLQVCDFFVAVEHACEQERVAFEFETEEVDLDLESDDDTEIPD